MFDTARELEITIPGPENKTLVVRWPTDQEWMERARKQKTLIQSLGRGASQVVDAANHEPDVALVDKIRMDREDGPEIDDEEAALVIQRISHMKAEEPTREGTSYRIPLRVPGALTEHVLRVPWTREVAQYKRAAGQQRTLKNGVSEIRVNLQAGADLYDTLHEGHEGYANGVPVIHKAGVIVTMLQEMDSLMEGDEDEDF